MQSLNADYLLGKWNLVSFKVEYWGMKFNWGKNAAGWIAYDKDGKMGVEIKAEKSMLPYTANLMFNNILSYGGSYKIQGNLVIHHLEFSSKKAWIGTDLVREVLQLDEKNLVLHGGSRSFGYTLAWAKSN